jgi:catechol 2,3-dioxygenase-like lactoylglutathione lyase family enzyme
VTTADELELGLVGDRRPDNGRLGSQLRHGGRGALDRAMSEPRFRPRLNHVAISTAREILDDSGRKEILDFYGDVFGWTEGDNTGEEGNPLILYTGAPAQFVYLLPSDEPLTAPALDHFGLQVSTLAELHGIVARAEAYRQRDERVRIIDIHARTTQGPTAVYTLTSAYIGFVLPLMIELQHIEKVTAPATQT